MSMALAKPASTACRWGREERRRLKDAK